MKHLLLAAILPFAWLAACGGNGDDGTSSDGDAGIDAPLGPCDPLLPPNQQNCEVGQRCTWIVDSAAAGHIGCVADGTLPLGAQCESSAGGQPDRCTTGTYCIGGICEQMCGFGAAAACPADKSCARYVGAFASGD